jgi:glycine betaine/proline transport system substrate-binding protein
VKPEIIGFEFPSRRESMSCTKKWIIALMAASLLALTLAGTAAAYEKYPGKGKTAVPARCTWDTGFFQEALVRRALAELGFNIKEPASMSNPIFYQAVSFGDVDYWAHGWMPNHKNQLPKNFNEGAEIVGYLIKAGGLQGYLVSKQEVEELNIKSLDDFKRPDVKKRFDQNGDGKADLVACPPGWGCEKVITHHMDVYKMHNHVNAIKAAYAASMADAVARFNNDEPVFFYTWTPNWTVNKLKPGKDVVWINVPSIIPTKGQRGMEDDMVASGVKGAVTDPIKMGFVANDIRVVAHNEFLNNNPAAKKLFELMEVPFDDIAAQNSKMFEGEDDQEDIERHATEWIMNHKDQWIEWQKKARMAAE